MAQFRIAATPHPNEHTPSNRRGAIDIARAGSLLVVVLGHLAMAVVDRDTDGALQGVNIIELYPRWEWLTMLAPMPLFFAASGWANTSSSTESARARVRALTGLATVVAAAWSVATLVEWLIIGEFGIIKDGARLATQPLWFLAAWVPLTVGSRHLTNAARHIRLAIPSLLVLLIATDVSRFVWNAPRWVGFPGFFAAWSVPWILGAWWRLNHLRTAFREKLAGVLIAISAALGASVLVKWFGYRAALIDAIPNKRSNTTPPTLFTAISACVQVGILMMTAQHLDLIAERRRRLIARISAVSAGVYAWHLTAFSLCGAALAAGLWTPERMTAAWWLSRPIWFAFVLSITGALLYVTQRVGTTIRRPHVTANELRFRGRVTIGATSVAVGSGLIGLYGPRTIFLVILAPTLLATGWISFRD